MEEKSKPFVSLQLDDELLEKLKIMIAEDYVNRSTFIRRLVIQEWERRQKQKESEK